MPQQLSEEGNNSSEERKSNSTKDKKRREMAIRFGKSMIKKTFQPMKKNSVVERRKNLGIDENSDDDILVMDVKPKKRSVVDMSLFESSDDEEEKVNSESSDEDEIIQKKKKRKVSSTPQKSAVTNKSNKGNSIKISKTAKYYNSLGVESSDSTDLEFIEITSNSKKKILEIKELVDSSLNYDESEEEFMNKPYKLFICMEKDSRKVIGCLIAEKISAARRIHFTKKENSDNSSNSENYSNGCDDILSALFESFKHSLSQSIGTEELHSPKLALHPSLDMSDINFDNSSNEKEKAVCGVSRIWVSDQYRRRGIATKLLDYTRKHLCYAYQVPRRYIALTPFTPLGFKFFIEYLSKGKERIDSVLVY